MGPTVMWERKYIFMVLWEYLIITHIKSVYWPKRYILNENEPIERKCAYWMKMYILIGYNLLGINSYSYLFIPLFHFFFRNTRNLWVLLISKDNVKCGDHSIQNPTGMLWVSICLSFNTKSQRKPFYKCLKSTYSTQIK